MRITAQVFAAYFVMLLMASAWRLLPASGLAPDVVALFAAYLGITARGHVAPAALGAAILGYLGDLLMGTPPGLQATTAAFVCLAAHLLHRRMLVRGLVLTILFALLTGLTAGFANLALRGYFDLLPADGAWWWSLLATAGLTGIAGPVVFRLARAIDRRFIRLSHLQSPVFD